VDSKGQSVIYFIVADEWISTGIKCAATDWDVANNVVYKTHPKYYQASPQLLLLKSRAENYISNLHLENLHFNRKYFIECLKLGKDAADNPCFLKLIDEYCNSENLSWARVKHYREFKKDITAIIVRPKLHDINFQFANRLRLYLKNKKGKPNCDNTIIRKIKQLKAVIHYCQKCGMLLSDPLVMIKLKEIKGNKQHLSANELQQLQELFNNKTLPDNLQNCLQFFLFSCYTGLRFSDITKLETTHLLNNCIRITQQKTDKPVFVPLIPQAQQLICVQQNYRLFKTFTNQPTNRYLKEIMIVAGIEKHITYHCSRHTFGTLSIYWGIPKEVVAEIMGVDMKTVNVYAKMLEEVKIREMLKWGNTA
jgi:site-specific recombinase XerD